MFNYIFMYKQNTVQYTIFTTSPTWFDLTPQLGGFSFYKTTSTKGYETQISVSTPRIQGDTCHLRPQMILHTGILRLTNRHKNFERVMNEFYIVDGQ